MPKRTNEFQQLVRLIEGQLSDSSEIEESAILSDPKTGDDVEIDLIIRSDVNSIPICIGIECTAKGRRADIEWVRQMIAKHEPLPIDKTVLVSKSGFTKQAMKRADVEGMLAVSIEEASNTDWLQFLIQQAPNRLSAVSLRLTSITIRLAENKHIDQAISIEAAVHVDGKFNGPLIDFTEALLRRRDVFKSILHNWLAMGTDERPRQFKFSYDFDLHDRPRIQVSSDTWREFIKLKVHVSATIDETLLELSGGPYRGQDIAFGTAANIFSDKERSTEHVLINLLGRNGRIQKSSIMFPGNSHEQAEVHDMKLAQRESDSD